MSCLLLRFWLTSQSTPNLLQRPLTKPTLIASYAFEIATQCQPLFTSAGALILSCFSSSSEKPELQLAKMSQIITAALIKTPQAASPPNSESAAATALCV